MAALAERDVSAMLHVAEGVSAAGLEPFPRSVLIKLEELIRADAIVAYQEIDFPTGKCRLLEQVELSDRTVPPAVQALGREFSRQDPLRHQPRRHERRALKLSDFLTRRALLRLDFYREVWRPLGIDDSLRVWLPASDEHAHAIVLERGGRSFTERDRTVLQLLRPHLSRIRANAEFRRRSANGALGLTEREAEVLGWIAHGKTNQEISSILVVSPHTVRKHVENIFEKLGVHTRTAAVAHAYGNGNGNETHIVDTTP
jgi:DNA-binding CsgD family transcriptional regulator